MEIKHHSGERFVDGHDQQFDDQDHHLVDHQRPQTKAAQSDSTKIVMAGSVNLNADVLMEILSRVPISSLVRLTRVCKLWHGLIHDRSFQELHSKQTQESGAPTSVITMSYDELFKRTLTLLDSSSFAPKATWLVPEGISRMTTSCNGLVCIYGIGGHAHVLNPATGERIVLPNPLEALRTHCAPRSHWRACPCAESSYFHFGFHPSTKKYKVVAMSIRKFSNDTTNEYECSFQILTLGGNFSWRMMPIVKASPHICSVCINGVMYWAGLTKVMAFDLGDEKFASIACHVIGEKRSIFDSCIMELEGKLCIAASKTEYAGLQFDLWILNDVTDNNWTFKCRIAARIPTTFREWVYQSAPQPIILSTRKGKGLFKLKQSLCYYDLQSSNGSMEEVYSSSCPGMKAQAHVEGLVFLQDL